ncbi:MAG TPA: glycosyltransferase [bacterium]|nr:glycosyltransferase [bacterium]
MSVNITPENAVFVLLSFEGPDPYSQAGGLGTRVHNLGLALGALGFETHLFFIGDPSLPGRESLENGKYTLHRWCQWISAHHPSGVYDGEDNKVNDYAGSVPYFVLENIARPAAAAGKHIIVMAEEWHTVEAQCHLSDLLNWHGIRDKSVFLWNANNTMSFHKINWGRLCYVARITTVSKFMKQVLAEKGLESLVLPNGIPERMLEQHDPERVKQLKAALSLHPTEIKALKIGRFDPAKRWTQAVEAAAILKQRGVRSTFLFRGGLEPHAREVFDLAAARGLSVADVLSPSSRPTVEQCIDLIASAPKADILHLRFFLPEDFVRLLYHCCDCVFANSGFEPFGLVGLEVMASGGIAFTGETGEEYSIPFVNAVTVQTGDPRELVVYLQYLVDNPHLKDGIKREAHKTAGQYTWPVVINNILRRVEYLSM